MTSASIISKAEKSYIQTSFLSNPSLRTDGRALLDFRPVSVETGVVPLANGSARLNIGRNAHGGGGTEVLAAAKLEVENIQDGEGVEGGRIVCTVSCSPAAYPHLQSGQLDDLQHDMTTTLHQTLSHPSLHPANLGILQGKKSWLLNLDLIVLADSGNVYDALFMTAKAALWDTKVPRTRSVEYKAIKRRTGGILSTSTVSSGDMDVDEDTPSGFDTRQIQSATDFELLDYWDEGDVLGGRDRWPVCITLNVLSPIHYLDATLLEESSTPLRLLLIFSFCPSALPSLQAMRLFGNGELKLTEINDLIKDGEKYARQLFADITTKLKDEDFRRNQKASDRFSRRQIKR